MNSIPGENRELDALVNQPKETHKKGGSTYLALTFGTLLSSQRADALVPRPCGPSFEAVTPLYTVLRNGWTAGSYRRFPGLGARSVLARCRENGTPPWRLLQGVPRGLRSRSRTGRRTPASCTGPSATAVRWGRRRQAAGGPSGRRTIPRCAVRPRHARRSRWHAAVPPVRRHRGAGTGRSPGGPPVGRSWGCSAPTCAGTTRP
jgi:hypothetical protein